MELHGEEKDQWSHVVHRLLHRPVPLPTSATAAAGVRPRNSDDAEIIVGSTIIKNQNNKANDHQHQYTTASTNSSHDIIANKESPLENLPPDTASHILTYLHPHDLFHLALLSKKGNVMFNNDLVWKWKFRDRWNCIPDKLHKVNIRMHGRGSTSDDPQKCRTSNNVNAKKCNKQKQTNRQRNGNGFWKQCYINAHCNPHDLWIRHWNCVSPEDVTTCVGRTAIPEIEFEDGGDNVEEESGWEKEWLRVREQLLRKRREDAMSVEQGEIMNDQERERVHKFRQDFDSPSLRLCPTCRYHPMLHPRGYEDVLRAVHDEVEFAKRVSSFSKVSPDIHNDVQLATTPDPVETTEVVAAAHALLSNSCNESNWYMEDNSVESTPARAIHYSTQYSIAKWCRNLRVGYARNDDEGTIKTEINNRNNSLLGGYCDLLSERIQWGNEMDCASSNDVDLSNDSSQGSSKRTRSHNTNSNPIQIKAQFAFKCASTYNRKIEPTQFNSSGVNFLTDALFFNIHASYEKDRTAIPSLRKRLRSNSGTETASPAGPSSCNETLPENKSRNYSPLDELLLDLQRMGQPEKSSSNALSGLGPNFETSHHSWHIIRLTNPEYILPITFRAYIQCPEIFTVYPSEGYLKPGETIHLVLGVRMKGSLMNEAFENIDVEREEVDPGLARVYAAEAHPPFVPFAIRYMFAPAPPCVPHDFVSRTSIQTRSTFAPASLQQSDPSKFPDVVDHLWENVTSEADVRTIYISAHINSNYGFDEFQCATLTPFDISIEQRKKSSDPSTALLTAIMPNLQQKNPAIFSEIQNMEKELEDTIAGSSYRTEKRCICCKRDWGPRSEELGRAYLLRKLECEKHSLIRTQQQKDFERTLKLVPSMLKRSLLEDTEVVDHGDTAGYTTKPPYHELSSCLDRICQLLFCIHTDFLLQKRADRLVSEKERILYVSYERYVDETYSDIGKCLQIINLSSNAQKWRNRGVYENARCTDWVLKDLASPGEHCTYKPEPNYLQRFGLLDHNPGRFNIGRQDDQNHGFDSFIGRQPPYHTDIFHNNPCAGFLSAVSMIGNPMSLVGHGVFDRMKKPGSIIRCPSLPREVYFRLHLLDRDKTELVQRAASLIEIWTSLSPLFGWRQKRRYCTSQVYFGWKTINFEINEQDPDGFSLVALGPKRFQVNHLTSMAHFICNIPLPGQGRFHLSSPKGHVDEYSTSISVLYTRVQPYADILFPSPIQDIQCDNVSTEEPNQAHLNTGNGNHRNVDEQIEALLLQELNIVWLIARFFGWTVDDDANRGSLFIDRRILIAANWFSNTVMVVSLLASLLTRHFLFVTDPTLIASNRQMRFWTYEECIIASIILFIIYVILGRMSERQISRSYERELTERLSEHSSARNSGMLGRACGHISLRIQRLWDSMCPLFLQQLTFTPKWNRRIYKEIMSRIAFERSKDNREHRSSFCASNGRGRMPLVDAPSCRLGFWSYLVGLGFAVLSFLACSPHFIVNSLAVFCCSLSYGISMSLESIEITRRTTSNGVLSLIKPRRFNTLVVGFILMGQLVGSSGGIMFLAEFVVTSVCLLIGGITITARALESWITFFCLSSTAFWGYVFARLGVLDGIKKKRCGLPSLLLCLSLWLALGMWLLVFMTAMHQPETQWQSPGTFILGQIIAVARAVSPKKNIGY